MIPAPTIHFSLSGLMAIIALAAVVCAVSAPLTPTVGVGLCLLHAEVRKHFGYSLAVVCVAIYAPFSWLLLADYPWNSYRLTWLKLWPNLPGFLPTVWLLHARVNDSVEFKVMGIVSLLIIAGLTWLGSKGGWRLAAAFGTGLLISVPTSLAAYAAFRS